MASHSTISTALAVLHYLAPLITGVYFLIAKLIAAIYLHQPSKNAGAKRIRYSTIALLFSVVVTLVAEGITCITQAINEDGWYASKDYTVYLATSIALHGSLALGIIESTAPLWDVYLGAFLAAFILDAPIIALQCLQTPDNEYEKTRVAFSLARSLFLLVLGLFIGWFVLSDRMRSIKLEDGESEDLVKPSPSPRDSLFNNDDSEALSEVGYDDEDDIDSDSEDPEGDRKLKAQQKLRLQQSGSWLRYLAEYKIFIPLLLPRDDRWVQFYFLVVGLVIACERILHILVPASLGAITNALATNHGEIPWQPIGLWMLYTALDSGVGLSLVKEIAELPIRQYTYKALSTTAFRHVMTLSMDFHNDKNSGEVIRSIEQGTNLQSLVDFVFFEVGPMFFDLVAAFVYVAFLFDIYMSMILFAVGVGYIYIGAKVTLLSVKQRRVYNTTSREESKVQNEAINNWQTVSHFNRADYESTQYVAAVDTYNTATLRYWRMYYIGGGIQSFLLLAGEVAAVLYAAYRVSKGAPLGNFITLVTYWRSIQGPLASVSYTISKVSGMLTDSERLLQLLTTKPSIVDAPEAKEIHISGGEVVFDNVDFAYDPRKPALQKVNFTVNPGQTVALVGETGSGKSTLLKLLYRYYDVQDGAIRIDGQDIREVTLDSLRDIFGMVPQDPSLFNISIMENIRYARLDATDEEVKEACKAASIHDKIESFPDGYKAIVGERGVKLSGGEKQRVAIARAILRQPRIVLLDEATSQIDAETEAKIQTAFGELTAQRTTFIVAHRLSTIQHADIILVISDGQIVERGTHEELSRLSGKYAALLSKQLNTCTCDKGVLVDVSEDAEEEN